jgi:hypothetical protein
VSFVVIPRGVNFDQPDDDLLQRRQLSLT